MKLIDLIEELSPELIDKRKRCTMVYRLLRKGTIPYYVSQRFNVHYVLPDEVELSWSIFEEDFKIQLYRDRLKIYSELSDDKLHELNLTGSDKSFYWELILKKFKEQNVLTSLIFKKK